MAFIAHVAHFMLMVVTHHLCQVACACIIGGPNAGTTNVIPSCISTCRLGATGPRHPCICTCICGSIGRGIVQLSRAERGLSVLAALLAPNLLRHLHHWSAAVCVDALQ